MGKKKGKRNRKQVGLWADQDLWEQLERALEPGQQKSDFVHAAIASALERAGEIPVTSDPMFGRVVERLDAINSKLEKMDLHILAILAMVRTNTVNIRDALLPSIALERAYRYPDASDKFPPDTSWIRDDSQNQLEQGADEGLEQLDDVEAFEADEGLEQGADAQADEQLDDVQAFEADTALEQGADEGLEQLDEDLSRLRAQNALELARLAAQNALELRAEAESAIDEIGSALAQMNPIHRKQHQPEADTALEQGADEALEQGADEALEQGADEGLEQGADEALEQGADEALEQGADEALEQGADEGLEQLDDVHPFEADTALDPEFLQRLGENPLAKLRSLGWRADEIATLTRPEEFRAKDREPCPLCGRPTWSNLYATEDGETRCGLCADLPNDEPLSHRLGVSYPQSFPVLEIMQARLQDFGYCGSAKRLSEIKRWAKFHHNIVETAWCGSAKRFSEIKRWAKLHHNIVETAWGSAFDDESRRFTYAAVTHPGMPEAHYRVFMFGRVDEEVYHVYLHAKKAPSSSNRAPKAKKKKPITAASEGYRRFYNIVSRTISTIEIDEQGTPSKQDVAKHLGIGASTLTKYLKEGKKKKGAKVPGGKTIQALERAGIPAETWEQSPTTSQDISELEIPYL